MSSVVHSDALDASTFYHVGIARTTDVYSYKLDIKPDNVT